MSSSISRPANRKAWTIAAAIVSVCAWFGVPGDTAMVQAKISDEEAKEIAVKAVPGEVTDFAIEKRLGANAQSTSSDGGRQKRLTRGQRSSA